MELMQGGSLRKALQQPEWQRRLRWADRWAPAGDGRSPAVDAASRAALAYMCRRHVRGGQEGAACFAPGAAHAGAPLLCGRGWRVACDVAEALLFLHSRSVIHSDLKAA